MQIDIFEDMDTGRVMTERQVDASQSDGRGGVILHDDLRFMLSLIWRIRLPVKYLAGVLMLTIACGAFVAPANSQTADKPVNIVVLGDSLSAGFGLAGEAAFPSRLAAALSNKGIAASVGNAGLSGDTASGGLERLDWSVPPGTDAVILELGANDMLRGIDPVVTKKALDT